MPTGKPGKLTCTVTGVASGSRSRMLASIRKGLPFSTVRIVELAYGLSRSDMTMVLAVSPSTLTRRQKQGRLLPGESDRLARFAQLKDAALDMMHGDDDAAVAWLRTPLDILSGETPIQRAGTEMGARDVEQLIGRIRHGVFS